MARLPGSFWPSAEQELLLAIALGDSERALTAWRTLRTRVDLDNLEPGSFTLLPLVYRTLSQADVKDSRLERLKGIYRSTWAKNHVLLDGSKAALAGLGDRVVVLDGIATAARFYGEIPLRPTPMLELLAGPNDRVAAARALEESGWSRSASGATDWFTATNDLLCSVRSAIAADFPGGEVWSSSERAGLEGTAVRVLSAADQLLASVVTGARVTSNRTIAWIPDAVLIIRSGRVDWERLTSVAIANSQTLRLRHALAYLSAHVDVPDAARERLQAAPVSRRERSAYALTANRVGRLGAFPQTVGEHLGAPDGSVRGLPRFIRERWGLDHGWQLPAAAGRRAWRVLRGRSA
jgi:hypothetical protein